MYNEYISIRHRRTQQKIKETYHHLEQYLDEDETLKLMCQKCKYHDENNHNYELCLDKMCFTFFLAFEYLEWLSSWEGQCDMGK